MPKGFPTDGEQAFSPDHLLPAYGDEDSVEEVLAKRKRTGGREKGTPNKQKKFELMKTMQLYGLRAAATMIEIMEDEALPPTVRLDAANKVIEYGFGKAKQVVEHGGMDGDEIKSRLIIEFVGQLPQIDSTTSSSFSDASASSTEPAAQQLPSNNVASNALNSPFRNAQLGRAPWTPENSASLHNKNQDVTDVIHKTVSVPVFTNPWEQNKK